MTVAPPIVVDLGRVLGREIEMLREGRGRLVEDLEEVMRLVRLRASADDNNNNTRIFLPIVAVYRRDD